MTATRARPAADEVEVAYPTVGTLVKEASEHFSTLVRSEIDLAKAEVKGEVKKATTGSVFLIIGAVLLVFALPFFFVALAEGLIAWFDWPRGFGFLAVALLFTVLAAIIAFLGIKKIKKVRAPEKTISSVKKNAELIEAVKGDLPVVPVQQRIAGKR